MTRAAARAAPQMLTVAEAAARMGVQRQLVYRWINSGEIAAVRYPSRGHGPGVLRIEDSEIAAFIDRCRLPRAG